MINISIIDCQHKRGAVARASEYQQALATAASTEKDQSVKDEIERTLTAITAPAKQ